MSSAEGISDPLRTWNVISTVELRYNSPHIDLVISHHIFFLFPLQPALSSTSHS